MFDSIDNARSLYQDDYSIEGIDDEENVAALMSNGWLTACWCGWQAVGFTSRRKAWDWKLTHINERHGGLA